MPKIHTQFTNGPTVSFEFFPPKSDQADQRLRRTLGELEPLHPSFVSITYGAGGSTRESTRKLVIDLLDNSPLTPMAHVTSVMHRRDELTQIIDEYHQRGVQNLMLLRGDPPRGTSDGFWEVEFASDLVELARSIAGSDMSIGVAAHPEGHPSSPDLTTDRDHLATKLQQADFAVTQFFFELEHYVRLVDDLAARGCDRPVIPGIMPITNVAQIERFAQLSGAAVPGWLADLLHRVTDDRDEVEKIGVEVATELCGQLLAAGAPGLHFYTLNHSSATRQIHAQLGL